MLSKSKIIAYRQCPKRLWLEVHRPDLREDSESTQHIQNQGNVVGAVAHLVFDPDAAGTVVDPHRDGWSFAFEQTRSLLQSRKPIFEGSFNTGNALSLADVLLPSGPPDSDEWQMIEVKSSTGVKDYHLDDIAIQSWIARHAGLNLKSVAIACIDSSWTYPGDKKYDGLLRTVAVDEEVGLRASLVPQWIEAAGDVARAAESPAHPTGAHCTTPFECGFINHCNEGRTVPDKPMTWLPRIQSRALREFAAENPSASMTDVPDDLLNTMQLMVKRCTLDGAAFHDGPRARQMLAGMNALEGRLFFLDFETMQFAVPIWAGTRPYQQLPFQFSCHVLEKDGTLRHEEFLDVTGADPTRHLASALLSACNGSEPIVSYNASFERSRILELAERYADLRGALNGLADRLIDLLPVVRASYYHPSQKGSWSIKAVLPAIAPDLNYDQLEGIQNGGHAVVGYLEAIAAGTTDDRKVEIRSQLLSYCRLDTLAMVRVWRFLVQEPTTLPTFS